MQEHDGVKVYRFRTNGMRFIQKLNTHRLWWTKNRLETGISMYQGLKALRRTHQYDIVEMPECGGEGFLINYLMRATTLVRFHSPAQLIMSHYDVRRVDIAFCSLVERIAFRGSSAYSSCSRFLAQEVRKKLGVRHPIRVIPNGIDLDVFDAAGQVDIRRKFGIRHDLF